MGFDYTGANPNPKCLPVTPSLIPLGTKDDPIFIADPCPRFIPTGLHDVATGLPIMAMQVCVDGAAVPPYPLGYFNENGEFIMTTGANVGVNAALAAAYIQYQGDWAKDYFLNDGPDPSLTVTAADLLATAIAAGVQVKLSDGTQRLLAAGDTIGRIDFDLKPTGSNVDVLGTLYQTGTSDATFQMQSGIVNLDPGASQSSGELRDAEGFLVTSGFEEFVIATGTAVVVSIIFISAKMAA